MDDMPASADRSPKCTYLGCSQPATYGVERAYMSPMVYCLEHMEEIAHRKSSGPDPAPGLQAVRASHKSTSQPRGDHHR
jgi:hypothetical protein